MTVATCVGLLVSVGASSCGSDPGPPPAQHLQHRPAPVADSRQDAAPLIADLGRRITREGSARTFVRGNLGIAGGVASEGTVRYRGPAADITLGGDTQASPTQPKQDVDVTVVDGVGFLKSSLLVAEPGKPWVRVDPGGRDLGARILGPALDQLRDATDPRAAFAGVEPATKIQRTAPDNVDGRPATRYDLRVLTSRAAEIATDPQQRQRMHAAAERGQPELDYQLWVDGAGLPVQFTPAEDASQGQHISLTSVYRDWGMPTEIQPPPPESVGVFPDNRTPWAQAPR